MAWKTAVCKHEKATRPGEMLVAVVQGVQAGGRPGGPCLSFHGPLGYPLVPWTGTQVKQVLLCSTRRSECSGFGDSGGTHVLRTNLDFLQAAWKTKHTWCFQPAGV